MLLAAKGIPIKNPYKTSRWLIRSFGGEAGVGRGDVDALRSGHAVSGDLRDCLALWRNNFLRGVVSNVGGFAQLRRDVASHASHTLDEHLHVIAWAISLSAVLCKDVDKAVSTPIDHGQVSTVWQSALTDRSNR